jgi:hypothetical protein
MFRSSVVCLTFLVMLCSNGCGSKDVPVDARTARIQVRLEGGLSGLTGKKITRVNIQPDGEMGFGGTAEASDGTEYTIKAVKGNRHGGKLTYEATSKDGKNFKGTLTSFVFDAVAKQDVPPGTLIEHQHWDTMLVRGTQYIDGDEPEDILTYEDAYLWVEGKVIKNELKKGQILKRADIVERDGQPWQDDKKARESH